MDEPHDDEVARTSPREDSGEPNANEQQAGGDEVHVPQAEHSSSAHAADAESAAEAHQQQSEGAVSAASPPASEPSNHSAAPAKETSLPKQPSAAAVPAESRAPSKQASQAEVPAAAAPAREASTASSAAKDTHSSHGGDSEHKAPPAAAAPAPTAFHTAKVTMKSQEHSEQDLPMQQSSGNLSRRQETAFERLTMPTSMRLLQKFGWTPENAKTFHIASGVSYNSKRLAPDEISSMVDRLCTVKPADSNDPGKLHALKLVYDESGKEAYVPVKEASKEENIAYMSQLYERCKETRQKTNEMLAAKYLQPLGKPRKA